MGKLENYTKRTSVRSFKKHKMSAADRKLITEVINNSPTSTNAQQFSAILIEDKKTLEWIAQKNWGQTYIGEATGFILFIGDRSRMVDIGRRRSKWVDKSRGQTAHETMRATVDASLAASYTMNALIELGYGTTLIGGIYSFGDELEKKLRLPQESVAVVGLSFGKEKNKVDFKPKMDKVFLEKYSKTESLKRKKDYNDSTKEYFAKRNRPSWVDGRKDEIYLDGKLVSAFRKGGQYLLRKFKKMMG